MRLCKAQRYRYANADMEDLERQLQAAQQQRFRVIVTDGVFSMDGNVCPLDKIYPLLLLPSIFPSIGVFSSESALHTPWAKCWSFSFSISPSNEYSGLDRKSVV